MKSLLNVVTIISENAIVYKSESNILRFSLFKTT